MFVMYKHRNCKYVWKGFSRISIARKRIIKACNNYSLTYPFFFKVS